MHNHDALIDHQAVAATPNADTVSNRLIVLFTLSWRSSVSDITLRLHRQNFLVAAVEMLLNLIFVQRPMNPELQFEV